MCHRHGLPQRAQLRAGQRQRRPANGTRRGPWPLPRFLQRSETKSGTVQAEQHRPSPAVTTALRNARRSGGKPNGRRVLSIAPGSRRNTTAGQLMGSGAPTPPPPLSLSLSPWMCPGDGGRPPPTATMPPRKVFPVAPRFSSLRPAASRPRSPGERRTRRFSRAAPLRLRAPLPLLPRPPQLIKSQENGLPPHAGGRRAMAF